MHGYKSLVLTAIDAGDTPFISLTLRTGDHLTSACTATKRFTFDRWGEVRDILGWASHAFLNAADQLNEDGWELVHTADCSEAHMAVADA